MNLAKNMTRVSFVVVAVLVAGLSACSNAPRPSEAAAPETLTNIPVAVVQTATVPEYLEAVGTVRAAQTSHISSQMMGNIVEISAREGDRVQAGQVLARIDDAQPRVAVEQATAALTAAEKESVAADTDLALAGSTLKRYQQLYDKQSISPQEYDEVKARYQSAEARRDMTRAAQAQAGAALVQAQTSLAYANVRAPFSGTVTEKKVDAGAFASPGMPIFTIEDARNFRLEVTVNESGIAVVRTGQTLAVTIDSLGPAQISARVAEIVPAADPASRSFLVKIALPPDPRIRSGLFGRADFSRGARSALLIPAVSVVQRGQLQGVYALDANRIAALRYVTLGKRVADKVEVLSGLQEGEKLVAAPGDRNFAGKRVATQP